MLAKLTICMSEKGKLQAEWQRVDMELRLSKADGKLGKMAAMKELGNAFASLQKREGPVAVGARPPTAPGRSPSLSPPLSSPPPLAAMPPRSY